MNKIYTPLFLYSISETEISVFTLALQMSESKGKL